MNHVSIAKDDNAPELMEAILEADAPYECTELFEERKGSVAHDDTEEQTLQALKENDDWGEEVAHLNHEGMDIENLFNEIDQRDTEDSLWWDKLDEPRLEAIE